MDHAQLELLIQLAEHAIQRAKSGLVQIVDLPQSDDDNVLHDEPNYSPLYLHVDKVRANIRVLRAYVGSLQDAVAEYELNQTTLVLALEGLREMAKKDKEEAAMKAVSDEPNGNGKRDAPTVSVVVPPAHEADQKKAKSAAVPIKY
jgi:hypothetical protein